jgi:mRNA interferase RelE/StbE
MPTAVRISEGLLSEAKKFSRIEHRSVTGQIEHWARMGKCIEENPDLTYTLIKEILFGIEELERGEKSEYTFGKWGMKIYQSRSFEKKVKRFSQQEKETLDEEIKLLADNPLVGEEKKGDLRGVYIHKFKIKTTQYLLSYRRMKDGLELIMIGPHENYYRDLKSYLKNR